MDWQQIKISVKGKDAERVSDLLSDHDAHAVTFVDARDTPMYEPKPGETLLWPDTQVIGLFPADSILTNIIEHITEVCENIEPFSLIVDQLEDRDWEREWMDNFHPMQFGKKLWICPSWLKAPDPDAINILLDPGLAFGTGTHATTRLCLEWLDSANVSGKVILDFGCGSGILAIAALMLGAKRVIGIDIDPQALQASRENASRNGVEERLDLYLPENVPSLKADIVIANILAAPLRELSGTISQYCEIGGQLVMSGILQEQADSVIYRYNNEFSFEPLANDAEWIRLSAVKKNNMSSPKS